MSDDVIYKGIMECGRCGFTDNITCIDEQQVKNFRRNCKKCAATVTSIKPLKEFNPLADDSDDE